MVSRLQEHAHHQLLVPGADLGRAFPGVVRRSRIAGGRAAQFIHAALTRRMAFHFCSARLRAGLGLWPVFLIS